MQYMYHWSPLRRSSWDSRWWKAKKSWIRVRWLLKTWCWTARWSRWVERCPKAKARSFLVQHQQYMKKKKGMGIVAHITTSPPTQTNITIIQNNTPLLNKTPLYLCQKSLSFALGSTSSISISSARVAMEPGKRSLAFIVLECWPIKKAPNLFKAK